MNTAGEVKLDVGNERDSLKENLTTSYTDEGKAHTMNEERQDLVDPLPSHWTAASLTDVVLYGGDVSPPCAKIRAVLSYYSVPFRKVNGKKPDSEYKKIPVLDVNGRQINDSFIMVKALAPVLSGKALTKQEVAFEELITFGLMIALEKEVASSVCGLCQCACQMCLCPGFLLACFAPCIACFVGPGIGKHIVPTPLRVSEYAAQIQDEFLGETDFIAGDKPGLNDISLFGLLSPFVKAGNSAVDAFLGTDGARLREWHSRMAALDKWGAI